MESYIYVLHNKQNNLVKIGISKDVKKRKRTLENNSGCILSLEFVQLLPNAKQIEKKAHSITPRRCQGEWFAVSVFEAKSSVIEAIESINGFD